ncbi:anti-anti-sigma regulatory factor (antagonist of anti-sigma factor) [Mycolicibacterium rhodesiae NBB3]|jgi:anti-anti-sigma factor|uniref:Anti-anti-sigma regulatory factor (Antagonist of anti-sigma factor) n=1 Tax=Mycolicibacterium rhodesiae (strain NBB3) TaxID=710685 RepID=G8RSU5_MYCRN|nr:STAS domain-containing protein [Mycolicibacterium rhodesiae]AEV71567.1 anti-anti-sigma regulatory factor (antagonist of anti-sigma factor) [Mycolicibacterium rhodesiae NBB3]
MAVGTVRIGSPDPSIVDEHRQCGKATFAVRRLSPSRHAVAVIGDIDAENGRNLGRFVEEHTGISRQLVLDLRAVDFAGTQAFTALYYISVHCSRNDVDWIIVGSHPVRRLLSICDPDGELPFVDDLTAGLNHLERSARCHQAVRAAV